MSKLRTAWDLTFEFGQIAVGEKEWDVGIGVAFIACGDKAEALTNQLTAIPADAVEQIARLREELAWAKGLVTKLAAEAAAGVEARRG